MSSTTLIIICLACVCFHLRKLRENMENKKDSSSSNSVVSNYTPSKIKFKKPIKLKLKNIKH